MKNPELATRIYFEGLLNIDGNIKTFIEAFFTDELKQMMDLNNIQKVEMGKYQSKLQKGTLIIQTNYINNKKIKILVIIKPVFTKNHDILTNEVQKDQKYIQKAIDEGMIEQPALIVPFLFYAGKK